MMNKNKGMALIAAMVIVLIVSIVAIAIASTSVSNRIASFSTYDTTSSYANSQAGINLGEVILMTASTDEISNSPEFSTTAGVPSGKVARMISSDCKIYNDTSYSLNSPGNCFWWLGNPTESYMANENFVQEMSSGYYDSDSYPNARTVFKLEERDETRTRSLESGDKLGKKFYRITSIGEGNTEGLSKIQGQIGVYSVIEYTPTVSGDAADY